MGGVTVGVDIGTTSVKAIAVDDDGNVLARSRIPHKILTPAADRLEHDANAAWRRGPRRAYAAIKAQISAPIAGVTVASMVPSLTGVDRRGIARLPGLLYGDARGADRAVEATPLKVEGSSHVSGGMPDAEGFLRWGVEEFPDATGFWTCQALATHSLSGVAAIDTAVTASMGELHTWGQWNAELIESIGARVDQLPEVIPMLEAVGTLPGSDTVFTGGSIDALCDQVVSGAIEPGDVLAIFGATLVVWIVTKDWIEVPGLMTVPHTYPDRVMVGGPSNAGALFVDWARGLLRSTGSSDVRPKDPDRVPIWLPYLRGERTPFNDPTLRASLHALDITQGSAVIERGAYEASGFVIRRLLERSGLEGRRIVASGGGSRSSSWMSAVADASGLPVNTVATPEGGALGAAFFARMAKGFEGSLDDATRWARTGEIYEPDPRWSTAVEERYERFKELGPKL
ncbi:MAG: xylulokinase [Acidimicrobiales bacterium]